MKSSNKVAQLVFASTGLLGIAYTPAAKAVPSKEYIEATYIRKTYPQMLTATTIRKNQILADIKACRKEIKLKAEVYMMDQKTRTDINATKLTVSIFNHLYNKSKM